MDLDQIDDEFEQSPVVVGPGDVGPVEIGTVDASQLAAIILAKRSEDPDWLDTLSQQLSSGRSGHQLGRILEVWGLSQAEFAHLMGVSRQAVGKWSTNVPTDRSVDIANLAAATDLLVHYLRRDRIPAVVRRPASALDDRSLIDLVGSGQTEAVLAACRQMFDVALVVG